MDHVAGAGAEMEIDARLCRPCAPGERTPGLIAGEDRRRAVPPVSSSRTCDHKPSAPIRPEAVEALSRSCRSGPRGWHDRRRHSSSGQSPECPCPTHEADIRHGTPPASSKHRVQVVALFQLCGTASRQAPSRDARASRANSVPSLQRRITAAACEVTPDALPAAGSRSQIVQHAPGIGADLEPGAEFARSRSRFSMHAVAEMPRRARDRAMAQPADAGAGDQEMRSGHGQTPSTVGSGEARGPLRTRAAMTTLGRPSIRLPWTSRDARIPPAASSARPSSEASYLNSVEQ